MWLERCRRRLRICKLCDIEVDSVLVDFMNEQLQSNYFGRYMCNLSILQRLTNSMFSF